MKGFARRSLLLLILLGASRAVVHADPVFSVRMDLYPTSGSGPLSGDFGGGAFKATMTAGGVTTTFATFCLEYNEHFTPGSTYAATIEPYAIYGGNGGAQSPDSSHAYTYDPVSSATQLLYKTFLNGGLEALGLGFLYNNDRSSYTALQTAIWSLENESWGGSLTSLASSLVNWATANNGGLDYGVRALNLWTGTSTVYTSAGKVQSQLISVPEPSSIVLLSISLLALLAKIRFSDKQVVKSK